MRTEDQVQRKLTELNKQKQSVQERLNSDPENDFLKAQVEKLEDMTLMLEWVLNAPTGSYHS
ncbi:hypothetical protein PC41400_16540 [Paenibacillus chitinolyticus]|uniref:Uncharacterized protein n=1 Tax=Paenibacillus chitinolyticus TaxID=79263 RepID=A0A410WYB7_9BACL|nr:hypothetical protein [Paenibacillus chitinolyticus]MCY9589827.1 hypothetical protein [Paenibacillus chitinolyticus]MCY9598172.1 hypothetical protein [Paenibacillus chitinolyticus]QAV19201.1 hypothetical protein PC41400_16540 [Paenibacillus chitinolyticus]